MKATFSKIYVTAHITVNLNLHLCTLNWDILWTTRLCIALF